MNQYENRSDNEEEGSMEEGREGVEMAPTNHNMKKPVVKDNEKLFTLAYKNSIKDIKSLLKRGQANINAIDASGNTILLISTKKGLFKLSKLAIKFGADLNVADSFGNTPLHYARALGLPKLIELLLSSGSNEMVKNIQGKTPIEFSLPINTKLRVSLHSLYKHIY